MNHKMTWLRKGSMMRPAFVMALFTVCCLLTVTALAAGIGGREKGRTTKHMHVTATTLAANVSYTIETTALSSGADPDVTRIWGECYPGDPCMISHG